MHRNRKLIGLIALLVLLLAGGTIAYNLLAPGAAGSGTSSGDTVEAVQPDGTAQDGGNGASDAGGDNSNADSGAGAGADADAFPAPDFTVYDADGNTVALSDFAGEPVVINFWASWCPPCKAELPDFEAAYQETSALGDGTGSTDPSAAGQTAADGGAAVRFLMVNLTDGHRETQETATSFISEHGYTFPVYYDLDYAAAYAYGINSIPMTVFVDADGNIADYRIGQIDAETLHEGIALIR